MLRSISWAPVCRATWPIARSPRSPPRRPPGVARRVGSWCRTDLVPNAAGPRRITRTCRHTGGPSQVRPRSLRLDSHPRDLARGRPLHAAWGEPCDEYAARARRPRGAGSCAPQHPGSLAHTGSHRLVGLAASCLGPSGSPGHASLSPLWWPWCGERITLGRGDTRRHRVPRSVLATAGRDPDERREAGLTGKRPSPVGIAERVTA